MYITIIILFFFSFIVRKNEMKCNFAIYDVNLSRNILYLCGHEQL